MAIMLLSCGWNARNVAAGGGGMNVVIVCTRVQKVTGHVHMRATVCACVGMYITPPIE